MTAHGPGWFWLVVFVSLWLVAPAWSNGDLFFEAQEIAGDPEYVVFGNVKDDRGRHLAGAMVTVSVDEPFLTYTVETDILGHYRTLDVGGELQASACDVAPHDLEQTGLVDRQGAGFEGADLLRIHVQADHVVAHFGEAGAGDEADVAGTGDGDFHGAECWQRMAIDYPSARLSRPPASLIAASVTRVC